MVYCFVDRVSQVFFNICYSNFSSEVAKSIQQTVILALTKPVVHDWCNKGCGNVLTCLWDGAYKISLAVNWEE